MKWNQLCAALLSTGAICCLPAAAAAPLPSEPASTVAQAQLSISFDANGGEGFLPPPITASEGGILLVPGGAELFRTARNGEKLAFLGWASRPDASEPEFLPDSRFQIFADWTFFAVYEPDPNPEPPIPSFTVTYQIGDTTTTETLFAGQMPIQVPTLPENYAFWEDTAGTQIDPSQQVISADVVFKARPVIALNTWDHNKYMDGRSDGFFHPYDYVTRAEFVSMLYSRLAEPPSETQTSCWDVPADAWYAKAVQTLETLDVVQPGAEGTFRPDDLLGRGDLAVFLRPFLSNPANGRPSYLDVTPENSASWEAISTVGAHGILTADETGAFHPGSPITRAEITVVFNRLLGRPEHPQGAWDFSKTRVFPDVTVYDPCYEAIMEATVSHTCDPSSDAGVWTSAQTERTPLADGFYRFNGWLYRVSDGVFLHAVDAGDGFTFDASGRYTTGSENLDQILHQTVDQYTNDSMTRDQKLLALYNHVRDHFTYLKRDLISKGQTNWEPAFAEQFLTTGKGNCYSFAATYCLLARQLGQTAWTVPGMLGRNPSPHCWVEMPLDGVTYMFDPQLEWRYLHYYGRSGYNLFKMLPRNAPFTYHW